MQPKQSPPSAAKTPKTTPASDKKLSPERQAALQRLQQEAAHETKQCELLTKKNTLTQAEYAAADAEFKTLIDVPWKLGEPIYIMPEFDDTGRVHTRLQAIQLGIEQGLPYHRFIPGNYGTTWPLLLRLLYGLKSGFKISIEQMESMLEVSYWRTAGLDIEVQPFFDVDPVTKEKKLNNASERAMFMLFGLLRGSHSSEQYDRFRTHLLSQEKKMPMGECSVQVVHLNADYLRFARITYDTIMPPPDSIKLTMQNVRIAYDQTYAKTHGKYSPEETKNRMTHVGADMLGALLHDGAGHTTLYRVFFLQRLCKDGRMGTLPALIFPSPTILREFYAFINLARRVNLVRRLGLLDLGIIEYHADRNEKVAGFVAPGVTSQQIGHNKVLSPIFALGHDKYHWGQDALIPSDVSSQITQTKTVMQRFMPEDVKYTSETVRCLDRERAYVADKQQYLYNLLQYVFSFSMNDVRAPLSRSAVIVLIDMILSPQSWPFYPLMKERMIQLLLPSAAGQKPAEVELITRAYLTKTKNNTVLVAVLILCYFELKDKKLCKELGEVMVNHPNLTLGTWRKKPHGHLYPVLILQGVDYTFEQLATLSAEARLALLKESVVLAQQAAFTTALVDEKAVPGVPALALAAHQQERTMGSLVTVLPAMLLAPAREQQAKPVKQIVIEQQLESLRLI